MPAAVRDALLDWYAVLSSLSAWATAGIDGLDRQVGIPLVSALLLGLIGAAAPAS